VKLTTQYTRCGWTWVIRCRRTNQVLAQGSELTKAEAATAAQGARKLVKHGQTVPTIEATPTI
jgi:hypothetical protein